MNSRTAAFLHSPELEKCGYPESSPFKTQRAALTRKTVFQMGLLGGRGRAEVAPVRAARAEIEAYHAPEYLDAIIAAEKGHLPPESFAMGLGTPDCPVFKGMYDYAALAAGASLTGARLLLDGKADIAFNPSGGYHHAFPARAAGFCYINDLVLAAGLLASAGKRVLFLDIDVHHCDGVQYAFYARDDVMTVSMHESGRTLFPGTGFENEIGEGKGRGYTVNIPLPVGTYDEAYLGVFRSIVLPLVRAYDADILLVEIGMDTLAGDPLAHLHLTNNVHSEIVPALVALDKPLLVTGGGGYNVDATVRGWSLVWSLLCGDSPDELSIGLGGVMLGNTEWSGGLRDRFLLSDAGRRSEVDAEIRTVADRIRATVFPIHGI